MTGEPPRATGRVATVAAMILGSVVVLAVCYLLYRQQTAQLVQRQEDREVVRVQLLTQLMQEQLSPAVTQLRFLADGDALRRYVDGDPAALENAVRRARLFSLETPAYDQVRFLDESGQEVFRINQGGKEVPREQLQNKADRRYFQDANRLGPGEIYVSAFDLNIENGRIEQPIKPTLRFATPVFDTSGRRRGVYTVNYLGGALITRLQQASAAANHRLRLLNSAGYWLKAAAPSLEWGWVLSGRAEYTLARSDPALWSRMWAEPSGQRTSSEGVFTWQRILPKDYVRTGTAVHSDDAYLIMASEISSAELEALTADLRRIFIVATVALMCLMLISVWLFRGRHLAMRALRTTNDELERRVADRTAQLAQTLDELRYREDLLEETGRLANVGGWDFDPVTGAGRWTTEVARIHDLDPTNEPSKELGLTFYPGESRRRLEVALQEAIQHGTPYDLELEFISARGTPKWVRTISRPVVEGGKVTHMRGALQDVTSRKLGELQLRAQLQRLRLLEQITRATGERQDLRSILQVVARTLEEELPLDFCCVLLYNAEEHVLTVSAVGNASTPRGEKVALVERARIPIDENGLSRCVNGALVYEPDIAEHHYPFPERLLAAGLRAMVAAPLQIESKIFGVLVAARCEPTTFSSGECEFLRQLSEHVALAANQAQIIDALESAYRELHTTQHALIQQERLRALGEMASGIAHDINNAISPVGLYVQSLLEREPGLSDKARNYLTTIQRAVDDVADTVARMRDFYRPREPELRLARVALNSLIQHVVELTRPRWSDVPQKKGLMIRLQLDLDEALPEIMGSEGEIRDALTNLIFNAVDAMPDGGTLTLRTRQETSGRGTQIEKRVWVEVADTGVGMDEATRQRCLEPFYTTKGERGTGLGLAMVYGMVQRHSAELEIDSGVGQGTTVRVAFIPHQPVLPEDTLAPRSVAPALDLRILLVDDDPFLIKSVSEVLEEDGHAVVTADGGENGINAFMAARLRGSPFDLVITDLGMPYVDGRKVAAAVKSASPGTPVVMLTGWGRRLIADKEIPTHVDRVLSKPPKLAELRAALAELTAPHASSSSTTPLETR